MAWINKLRQLSGIGGVPDRSEMAALLPELAAALATLHRCAELAPTPTYRADLLPLVAKVETVVRRARDLLRDFGAITPSPSAKLSSVDGHNHWARLLQALEQHRAVRQQLRELSIASEDTSPELSEALAQIGREEETVVDHLRNLIATADPQASN